MNDTGHQNGNGTSSGEEHPDLLALLRGQVANESVLAAEDHLNTCAPCRDELVGTVAGHALLTRTAKTLPGPLPKSDAPPVPPLEMPPTGRRPRLSLVAAAAAAVLVAGVGLGAAITSALDGEDESTPPAPQDPTLSASLDPIDGEGSGQVEMTVGADRSAQMTVRTTGLPTAPGGDFYYVWLLDPATNKMLPLGLVAPGGTATFRIDAELVAAYSAVDISLEADDGDPAHSVTSVLRGAYDLT